jgi:hypothetical protein
MSYRFPQEPLAAGFLNAASRFAGTDLMQNYRARASEVRHSHLPTLPPMDPQTTHLLYLHGFRSSPRSTKARLVAQRVAQAHPDLQWWCPQLPPSPHDAIDMVMKGIAHWPRKSMAVIGSSLGGFYATYVAGMTRCRAVLLNPAVHPARDLTRYIGDQTSWHDPAEHFYFGPNTSTNCAPWKSAAHAARARLRRHRQGRRGARLARDVGPLPGDSNIKLLEGGDHALSDFERAPGRRHGVHQSGLNSGRMRSPGRRAAVEAHTKCSLGKSPISRMGQSGHVCIV